MPGCKQGDIAYIFKADGDPVIAKAIGIPRKLVRLRPRRDFISGAPLVWEFDKPIVVTPFGDEWTIYAASDAVLRPLRGGLEVPAVATEVAHS